MTRARLLGMLLIGLPWGAAAAAEQVTVVAESAVLRATPDMHGAKLEPVSRGARLEVLSASGSWYRVRIPGSGAEGYVHSALVEGAAGAPASPPVAASTSFGGGGLRGPSELDEPDHDAGRRLGLGVSAGGGWHLGAGLSARSWLGDRLGLQGTVSRFSLGGSYGEYADSFSTTQLSPALLWSFTRHESDGGGLELLPYVGGGLTFWRTTYEARIGRFTESYADTSVGFHGFGGAELTFTSLPRLGVSGQIGYYQTATPLSGAPAIGGFSLGLLVHWYLM